MNVHESSEKCLVKTENANQINYFFELLQPFELRYDCQNNFDSDNTLFHFHLLKGDCAVFVSLYLLLKLIKSKYLD